MKRSSPISRYGGKVFLTPYLLDIVPAHGIYVEAFSGSASLLFCKQPAQIEVINDLDGDVVNFFEVVRNRDTALKLRHVLELTPYARAEFAGCKNGGQQISDPIEKARQFYVLTEQSINSNPMGSWSRDRRSNCAATFHRQFGLIEKAVTRLQNVQIENQDFEKVLRHFDSPDTLSFLDPPYMAATRKVPQRYRHEMTDDDHLRLLRWAKQAKGQAIICGYANPLYDEELRGWFRLDIPMRCSASVTKRQDDQPQPVTRRVETVWLNNSAVTDNARNLAQTLLSRQSDQSYSSSQLSPNGFCETMQYFNKSVETL